MSGHSSLFCSRHVASRICSHYVFQAATACGGLEFQVVDQGARLGLPEMGIWRRSGSDMKGRHIFRPGTMQGFEAPKARGETSLSVSSWKLHHRSSREYRDGVSEGSLWLPEAARTLTQMLCCETSIDHIYPASSILALCKTRSLWPCHVEIIG